MDGDGDQQRRHAGLRLDIDVRALIDQQARLVEIVGSVEEGRGPGLVAGVDVGAAVEQYTHGFRVAIERGVVEWRGVETIFHAGGIRGRAPQSVEVGGADGLEKQRGGVLGAR